MELAYFTEQSMAAYPADEALKHQPDDHPARAPGDTVLLLSNKYFDPVAGARLYNDYMEQYRLADELGFDAIMTNEHHTAPFCMQTRCNITSAFLAANTKRVKILQLGNPLPIWDNPVQLAEEIAMLDMMSGGRIISGIVRGGGVEQIANMINPAFNRERFVEAHDLLIKAWTVPGPFRWEGEHYQLRVVNPWALPLQKPHPRIYMPGVSSRESIVFAAEHAYPYVCLNTTLEDTKAIWGVYDSVAARMGYEAGPQHRGYLMRCHVADTEEKAIENGRQFSWMFGQFTGLGHPVWSAPTGYSSWEARSTRLNRNQGTMREFDDLKNSAAIICGTPETVVRKIRVWLEETRPGTLILWANDGLLSQRDSLRCIELLGKEVLPALRDIADELGLKCGSELNAPVSLAAGPPRP